MKITKTLAFLAAVTCFASALTACGNSGEGSVSESQSESETEAATEEETTEAAEEETTEAETDEESATEAETEAAAASDEEPDYGDIEISMEGTEATEENPVKFNEWTTAGSYSTVDSGYHDVAVRFTKVTTSTDDKKYVDDAIALNNKYSSDFRQIDVSQLKVPSDCELCVVDYEVYIPANFPTSDIGVTAPHFSPSVINTDGAGFPSADGTSSYIGLSTTYDLTMEEDTDYQQGNTYSFRALYIMVKGYDKIGFKITASAAGSGDIYDIFFDAK